MSKYESIACLSVRQPWADLIVAGIKPIENRSWSCEYKGDLLIHASKTWGRDEDIAYSRLMDLAISMRDDRRQYILSCAKERRGGLVGSCRMRMCISAEDWFLHGGREYDGKQEWFVGPFGFVLTGAKMFSKVIPYRGQQGLFRVPVSAAPCLLAYQKGA